jgi:hypothetical protein
MNNSISNTSRSPLRGESSSDTLSVIEWIILIKKGDINDPSVPKDRIKASL